MTGRLLRDPEGRGPETTIMAANTGPAGPQFPADPAGRRRPFPLHRSIGLVFPDLPD